MKKFISIIFLVTLTTACAKNNEEPKLIGMPNPASQYCIDVGGTLETIKKSDGWYSLCHLPNGKVIEEWQLYRSKHN